MLDMIGKVFEIYQKLSKDDLSLIDDVLRNSDDLFKQLLSKENLTNAEMNFKNNWLELRLRLQNKFNVDLTSLLYELAKKKGG